MKINFNKTTIFYTLTILINLFIMYLFVDVFFSHRIPPIKDRFCRSQLQTVKENFEKKIIGSNEIQIEGKISEIPYGCQLNNNENYRLMIIGKSRFVVFCPIHGFLESNRSNDSIEAKQEYFNKLCTDNRLNPNNYKIDFKDKLKEEATLNGIERYAKIKPIVLIAIPIYLLIIFIITAIYSYFEISLNSFKYYVFLINVIIGMIYYSTDFIIIFSIFYIIIMLVWSDIKKYTNIKKYID